MKDTFYFSHDYNARVDDKIKQLIRKHGMLGYGIFWAIIEDLYNNANALRSDCEGIAFEFRVDEKTVKSILFDFDLFVFKGDFFGSMSIQKRLDERNTKSIKAKESAKYRWAKDANAKRTQCERIENECDRNAIKERKGKDIKESNKEIPQSEISPPKNIIDKIVECFAEEYEKSRNLKYYITNKGKESSAAGKLLQIFKNKYPDHDTEKMILSMKNYFVMCLGIHEDNFIHDNLNLSLIINKFNEINNILKNGKSRRINTPATTDEQLITNVFAGIERGLRDKHIQG
jgi:hypothetical protein